MNSKPKYVAHRGLSLHAPENTIPAFELAGKSVSGALNAIPIAQRMAAGSSIMTAPSTV